MSKYDENNTRHSMGQQPANTQDNKLLERAGQYSLLSRMVMAVAAGPALERLQKFLPYTWPKETARLAAEQVRKLGSITATLITEAKRGLSKKVARIMLGFTNERGLHNLQVVLEAVLSQLSSCYGQNTRLQHRHQNGSNDPNANVNDKKQRRLSQ